MLIGISMHSKRFHSIVVWSVLGAVFLVPLFSWTGVLFEHSFPKALIFFVLTELALIFWLPEAKDRWKKFGKSPLIYAILGFCGVLILTSLTGADIRQSLFSNYERMMGLWTYAHVTLFFVILATSFTAEKEKTLLLWMMTASALCVSLVGFWQFILHGTTIRIESTLNNSAFLATYLTLALFAPVLLYMQQKRTDGWSYALLAVIALNAFTVILTGTRGAMIALAVAAFMFLLALLFSSKGRRRTIAIAVLGVLVGLGFMGYVFKESLIASSFDPLSRLASLSFSDSTVKGRFLAWNVGWEGIQERPLLGWGVENYHILFNAHYNPALVNQEPWYDRAHNFVIDITATMGIFGLVVYLSMYGAAWYQLRQKEISHTTRLVLGVAFLTHLVQTFFVFDMLPSLMILYILFALVHVAGINHEPIKKQTPMLLLPGVLIFIFLFVIGVWRPFQEARLAQQARVAFAAGADQDAKEYTLRALAYNTYGDIDTRRAVAEYVFDFLKAGGFSGAPNQLRNPEEMRGVINFAIAHMEENMSDRPQDVKWYMYAGELHNLAATIFGEADREHARKAEELFSKSKELSAGRPNIYLEIAQARKVQGNTSGMWQAIDEAKRLVPDHLFVYYNALSHAIDVGDRARELEELSYIRAHDDFLDYDVIMDAYFRNDRLADAIKIQEEHIAKKEPDLGKTRTGPQIALLYQRLAFFYKTIGEPQKARGAALRVGELNPDPEIQRQVQLFIQSL